jgi:hypothetical protein
MNHTYGVTTKGECQIQGYLYFLGDSGFSTADVLCFYICTKL